MLHQVGPIPLRYLLLQFQPVQPALQVRQGLQALPVQQVAMVQTAEQGLLALQDQRGPMALPDLQEQPLDSALLQQAPVLSV